MSVETFQQAKIHQLHFTSDLEDFETAAVSRQNNLQNFDTILRRLIKKGCVSVGVQTETEILEKQSGQKN